MPATTVEPRPVDARPRSADRRTVAQAPSAVGSRYVALDVFRGVTMASMVIVNNPGDWGTIYWPLEHAEWNGWTPTDLIYPFFLFIVGISLTLSRQTLHAPVWRLVRRALVLVALSLFLAGFPRFDPNHWRFTGILPRIALCYLASALLYRWSPPRARAATIGAVTVIILVGYWQALIRLGDLTPEGNIGAAIDRAVFGSHLYRGARWDPEGLLSSIPAIATTLFGVLAGMWLGSSRSAAEKLAGLASAGGVLFIAGELWHASLPINKNLWTSSYVVMTAGAAAIVLAVCIRMVATRPGARLAHPFIVLGSNAIALFVVSGLIGKAFIVWNLQTPIYRSLFEWAAAPKNASLLYALAFLAMMYAMCDWLYRRRILLKA